MSSSGAHRGAGRTALVLLQLLVFVTYVFGPTASFAEEPTQDPSPTESAAPETTPEPTVAPEPTPEPSLAPEPTAEPPATPDPTPEPSDPDPTPPPAPGTLSWMITFAPGTDEARQLEILSDADATDVSSIPQLTMRSILLQDSGYLAQLETLRANSEVVRVETDRTRDVEAAPSDSSYADQWSLPHVGWEELYGTVAIAGSATVAILDTGVDAAHPDLDGVVLPGTSVLDGSNGLTDPNGHGTWLAGIVAAETDNGSGIAGMAYAGVSILPVIVLGADGTGQDSDIIAGVVYAADAGADVILMAFSNPGYSAALQAAIDYAWASGAVLVAATGNDGSSSATFPAGDRGVIGVASTDASDTLAASSNYGAAAFMAAPGVDITTTTGGGGVAPVSGTSAAAAEVAGAAALLKANESFLSNGVIVSRLARNADPTVSEGTGNGRLNLARAMADASLDEIQPAGAAPIGDGGPLVGPYNAAASNFTIAPSSQSVAPGSVKNYSWTFTGNNNGNQATHTFTTPVGWTPPTTAAGPGNVTVTPGTCAASLGPVNSVTRVITINQQSGGCPTGTTFTLNYNQVTAPSPASPPASTTYTFNSASTNPTVTVEYLYFSDVSPSGNWNVASNWELCEADGSDCSPTAPANAPSATNSNLVVIRAGDTINVSAAATADQVAVEGTLAINIGQTLSLANGTGVDIDVEPGGAVTVNGTLTHAASASTTVSGDFLITATGTVNGNGGGGTTRPTFEIASGGDLTTNAGGLWDTGGGGPMTLTFDAGSAGTLDGAVTDTDVITIDGTVSSSGNITMAATSNLQVGGSLTLSGGTLTTQRGNGGFVAQVNNGGVISLGGSATWNIGTASTARGEIKSGGTLDIGPTALVNGGGLLQVENGSTLRTGSADGIVNSTTIGNVRTSGADSYAVANYAYDGATQNTGNALPATLASLTVASTGAVTLNNGAPLVAVNGLTSVTSGTFDQGPSTNLTAIGGLSVASGATYRNLGTGDLTLGSAGVSNVGTVEINAGGPDCGDPDDIQIRSTNLGTQRPWSGLGTFDLEDVNVRDQAGTAPISVVSGTNLANNGANWTFTASCDAVPPNVVIDSVTGTAGTDSTSPFAATTNAGATINWHANENGNYSVRKGGTDCSSGTLVPSTSGLYITQPATVTTAIAAADLSEGVNILRVCVADGALNTGASEDITVIKDTVVPNAPVPTTTTPASPANDNDPLISGTADGDVVSVELFSDAACTASLASGTAAAFTAAGIAINVADDSSTDVYATGDDAAGNTSACSTAFVTYVEDSTPPNAPVPTTTTPASPANDNDPLISGTADGDVVSVELFSDAACTASLASGTAAAFTAAGIAINVADDSSTDVYATGDDAAGNTSACSTAFVTYVEDSTAPGAPSIDASDPSSPANDNSPELIGTAEAGSTVNIYTDAACTVLESMGSQASTFAAAGITVSVADDSSTDFYATATDAAGNVSACSSPAFTYVEDSTAPDAPSIDASDPSSPANDNSPELIGTAEAGSTVWIYTDAGCTNPATFDTAAAFASSGITVTVGDDSTNTFHATATDAAGNVSGCSSPAFTYVEDSTAPDAPSIDASDPSSPANDNSPELIGTAEAGSTVNIYTDAACTVLESMGSQASTFAAAGITVSVADDSSTDFYATATDAAGNVSACSSPAFTYVEDSTPPNAPVPTTTTPASPANDNDPLISGTADGDVVSVELFSDAACTASLASGTAAAFTAAGIAINVADDSSTDVYATGDDAAGNTSACSTAFVTYVEDSTPPNAPVPTTTTPASPANDNDPLISGTADGDVVSVELFSDAACTASLASGTAAAFTAAGIAINVADDSSTDVYATGDDAAGNTSACSTAFVTYVEDSTAPGAPSIDASDPSSPANDNSPELIGTAEAGSTVNIYTDAACTVLESMGSQASTFAAAGITVSVADDSSTDFYATATDAAGNVSACSSPAFTYVEDSTAPTSTASVPDYQTATTFNVGYVADDPLSTGVASGLASVELWAMGPTDSGFALVDTDSAPGASGSFSYTAAQGDGTYSFYTVATDLAGNVEVTPATDADSTFLDTAPPTSTASVPDYQTATTFNVGYVADDPLSTGVASGLASVELWAMGPTDSGFALVDTDSAPGASGSFSYTAAQGDGTYSFYTVATDLAGNVEVTPATDADSTFLDTAPPTSTASVPDYQTATTFNVGYVADDPLSTGVASGLASVELWAMGPTDSGFALVDTDSAPGASGSFSYTAAQGDGTYSFYTVATDLAGNVEVTPATDADSTFLDTAPPTSTASVPDYQTATTFNVGYVADDPLSTGVASGLASVELWAMGPTDSGFALVDTDSAPGASGSFSYTAAQGDGTYSFYTVATDLAGNVEVTPATDADSTFLDTVDPTVTIDTTPADPTNVTSASFTFTATDPGANASGVDFTECSLDGAVWTLCSSPQTYAGPLSEGSHTFEVRATDNAGNTGPADSFTWLIDVTDPTVTIDTTPADPTNVTSASFTFTATDPGANASGVDFTECSLDGAVWTLCSSPQTYAGPLSEGSHTFEVRATDNAGNTGPADSFTWLIDVTDPTVTIDTTPADPTNVTSASFTFTATDPGANASGVDFTECSLDGAVWTLCSSPQTYAGPLSEGSHTFEVRATDNAGNTGPADSFTWLIDVTDPTVTIDTTPADPTNVTSASFTFTATDPGANASGVDFTECSLDGAVWTLCSSPQTYAGPLSEGSHTFEVRATDNAGNTGPADSFTWLIDVTDPTVTIDTTPADPTNVTSASFTFTATDPGANASGVDFTECSLDGAVWTLCSSPQTYAGPLSEGSHTFEVRATDNAGNTGPADSFTWKVDTTGPATSAANASPNPTNAGPTITASVTDLGAGGSNISAAEFFIDAIGADGVGTPMSATSSFDSPTEAVTAIMSPAQFNALTEGSHTVYIHGKDAAGNWGATTSTTFVKDTIAPLAPSTPNLDAASDSGMSNTDNLTNVNMPTFTGTAEAGSLVTIYVDGFPKGTGTAIGGSYSITTSLLTDGMHSITATATDAATNTSPLSGALTILIDTGNPASLIDFPGSGTYDALSWNAGCATAFTGDVCGTASDTGPAVVSLVQVALKNSAGNYWTGTGNTFAGTTPVWVSATGTTNWNRLLPFSTFPTAGGYTIFSRATDSAGNVQGTPTSRAFNVTNVSGGVYVFEGFQQPIDNTNLNKANAGSTIPVKWRITLNGVPVSDPNSFVALTSRVVSCETLLGTAVDDIETYTTNSGLQYTGNGSWHFNWKTPKSYATQCRIMTLTLNDGSTRDADFKFK